MGTDSIPRIIVVDDEAIIATTTALILAHGGFDAISFEEPEKALVRIREGGVDLLITDYAMPGMTGIDLGIAFKKECPNGRVLLMTGHALPLEYLKEAQKSGYEFPIVIKPVEPEDLLRTVLALLPTKLTYIR